MSKNLLQDMVKVKRARTKTEMTMNTRDFYSDDEIPKIKPKKTHYALWVVALFSIVFLFFAFSFLFSRATVTINPKIQDITINENLSAKKGGDSSTLSFDLVAISGEEIKNIQTNEMKDITEQAKGVAIIYNAFSTTSQILSIDTRLEGSNGKMYKTTTRITVPGMTKDGKPGSVEVGIYASGSGPEYNSVPLDFKIFGFKGTSKYEKIYARSRGAISGGFQGKFPVVSDADKTKAVNELKNILQTKLLAKVAEQIPSGFVLFKDAVFLDTDDSSIDFTSIKDNILSVKLKGTLQGILFNENKLTQKIAEKNIEKYDGSIVYISNIRTLKFTLSNKDGLLLADTKNIDFNLSGDAEMVWRFDTTQLVGQLLGKNKNDFNQILLQYSNIESADLVVSPIWKNSIPGDSKNIEITVTYPK